MCKHCNHVVKIDREDVLRALVHRRQDVDEEPDALAQAPDTKAGQHDA